MFFFEARIPENRTPLNEPMIKMVREATTAERIVTEIANRSDGSYNYALRPAGQNTAWWAACAVASIDEARARADKFQEALAEIGDWPCECDPDIHDTKCPSCVAAGALEEKESK